MSETEAAAGWYKGPEVTEKSTRLEGALQFLPEM